MKCAKCGYDDMGTGSAHVCIPFNYVDVEDAPQPIREDNMDKTVVVPVTLLQRLMLAEPYQLPKLRKEIDALIAAAPAPAAQEPFYSLPWEEVLRTKTWPAELHDDTKRLVAGFAEAMAIKLAAAERKYGYSNGWLDKGWMDECRQKLVEHLAKGDPRDVANYCAFLWWHNEKTAAPAAQDERDIHQVYDLIGLHYSQPIHVLMANLSNMKRFAEMLHAVEREFFMVPGEPDENYPDSEPDDECLVNSWGSTQEQYIEQFRTALKTLAAPQDAQERNAIIEECAKVCDEQATEPECPERAKYCADAIRALKTAQPADKPIPSQLPDPYDERDGTWVALKDKPEGKAEQQACHCDSPSWCKQYGKCNRAVLGLSPAQPQQLTDEEILALWCTSIKGVSLHPEVIAFARALLAAGKKEPLEMRLCEASRVWLKPNQPYIFTVDWNCEHCVAAAKRAEG